MSRVGKKPVTVPSGVEVQLDAGHLTVKGRNGSLSLEINETVAIEQAEGELRFAPANGSQDGWAMAGTTRSLVNNMVVGVTEGFERRLQLIWVGYRAKASGQTLNLALGFSHPVDYTVAEGISVETPSQKEVVLRGADKQLLGHVAAEIRAFRPPEPYKGKGIRYADEQVRRKEAKK